MLVRRPERGLLAGLLALIAFAAAAVAMTAGHSSTATTAAAPPSVAPAPVRDDDRDGRDAVAFGRGGRRGR